MNNAEYTRAKERALYILEARDHSYAELYSKLEKNYSEEICFAVCDKMTEIGLINDSLYAKKLAKYYFTVKKYGKYRAFNEMKRKRYVIIMAAGSGTRMGAEKPKQFLELEGIDIHNAAAVATASLAQAVAEGTVKKDEVIMLNITGGGELLAKSEKQVVYAKPHLVLNPELPAEEIVRAVEGLF